MVGWETKKIKTGQGTIQRETDKQTNKQTDKQTNKQTDKQTDKQTNRQTIRQTDKQTNGQTDKQSDRDRDRDRERENLRQKQKSCNHRRRKLRNIQRATLQCTNRSHEEPNKVIDTKENTGEEQGNRGIIN